MNINDQKIINEIDKLSLHQSVQLQTKLGNYSEETITLTRVPNGVLYERKHSNTMAFVPYTPKRKKIS